MVLFLLFLLCNQTTTPMFWWLNNLMMKCNCNCYYSPNTFLLTFPQKSVENGTYPVFCFLLAYTINWNTFGEEGQFRGVCFSVVVGCLKLWPWVCREKRVVRVSPSTNRFGTNCNYSKMGIYIYINVLRDTVRGHSCILLHK